MKLNMPQSHRSFALVEIIIAIGVLAVVSMFILQMFVRAANFENKARDKDMACFEAQNAVELYKTNRAPMASGLSEGRTARRLSAGHWELYYDSDWRPVAEKQDKGFVLSFVVSAGVHPSRALEPESAGAWDDIAVRVVKTDPYLMEDRGGGDVFSLSAGVYWPEGKVSA